MNKVIYTAVFGITEENNYHLHEPEVKGEWDFVCFTDNENFKSDVWDVRIVKPLYEDGARSAKRYKLKPHKYLSDYDISVWVDIEVKIKQDISQIVNQHLENYNLAILNHELCGRTVSGNLNVRKCIYEEAKFIEWLGNNHPKKHFKDNMDIIKSQVNQYKLDGYPKDNGLARTTVVFRRHNEQDVIDTCDAWWEEMKYGSKRDQLSFNYVAWKNNLQFDYIQEDIDDNQYFGYMKKWRQTKRKELRKNKMEFAPISLDYFLKLEFSRGGGGKEIITQGKDLITVGDVVNFFSKKENVEIVETQLEPKNWQYYNCMMGEFRKNVENHHDRGWENMTKDYYESLEMMSDTEIKNFLKEIPAEFDNGFIKHSWHRACSMIGRLVKGKSYIPFYMKKNQIYNEPRPDDNIQRIKPLIKNINGLNYLDEAGLPRGEYALVQSSILALMGVRQNDDVDIIISSEARKQLFNNNKNFIRLNGVEIFEPNRGKFQIFNAQGDDDLIKNYSFVVDGYNFLQPRFYFSRKNKHTDRDKSDWDGMRNFFKMRSHDGFPFNQLSEEEWGVQYL